MVSTPLKKIGQLGVLFPLFPLYGKNMFQTTNQLGRWGPPPFFLVKGSDIPSMVFSGSNRWRYVSTIFLAIFCWDIPANIGLKKGPKIYGIGTSNPSVPESWPLIPRDFRTGNPHPMDPATFVFTFSRAFRMTWYRYAGTENNHWTQT